MGSVEPAPWCIRPAEVGDIQGIKALIDPHVETGIMLPKTLTQLYESVRDFQVCVEDQRVIGAGALHVLWEDLAEIRSIAVHPKFHRRGLGSKIVDALIEESRALGIRRLFTFTLAVEFFQSFGFLEYPRNDIPPIVWVECSKCSKYYNCDETGMILQI